MLALLLLLLCLPSLVFAQGTVKSRTQAGDGTPITDGTSGRLDVTVQSPVNAAQSGTWNITNVSGTVSLPSGAATESTLAGLNGKFPTAFASADNIANQTATAMHGFLYAYDGTTWDRLLSTSGALHVNVQNASLAVTGTFWQATQPVSLATLPTTVGQVTLATGVTTNTTSATTAGVSGTKTFWGEVVCSSGACVQTQEIYGARTSTAANGLLLCTLTLTATTRDQDVCTGSTADYPFYYVVTTNTSGTAATGATYVFHH